MADVINIIRVVNIETKFDKKGNVQLIEHRTIQRADAEPLENLEFDYDADNNRRLVVKW